MKKGENVLLNFLEFLKYELNIELLKMILEMIDFELLVFFFGWVDVKVGVG